MGRYFVGVAVPVSIGEETLVPLTKRVEPLLNVKRWYGPAQFHLTLQFLGTLEADGVEDVIRLVTPHARRQQPFDLQLGSIGWFPRAKVVWCGVQGEREPLRSLQQSVAQALEPLGASQFNHGEYRPHITLGRLHAADGSFRPEAVDASDLLGPSRSGANTWTVSAIHLYESVSNGSAGPSYPVRHTFPLEAQA